MTARSELLKELSQKMRLVRRQANHLRSLMDHLGHPAPVDEPQVLELYQEMNSFFSRLLDGLLAPFRIIAKIQDSEEQDEAVPDLLAVMARRGIIDSVESWLAMRRVRSAMVHENWDTNAELEALVDALYRYCEDLLVVIDRVSEQAQSVESTAQ
jgi:hypothetical protein